MSTHSNLSFTVLDQNTWNYFQFCDRISSKKPLSHKYRKKLAEMIQRYWTALETRAVQGIPDPITQTTQTTTQRTNQTTT